jgi:glycosyltransferase involved in cell wall biosynthesis
VARAGRHGLDHARIHFGQGHWRAYRKLESMVPSGAHLEDTIRSHLLSRELTHVVPNGIDVEMFRPGASREARQWLGARDDAVLIVTLGRLSPDKGNDVALEAFARVPTDRVQLAIVGEGIHAPHLQRLAGELGLGDRVLFPGPAAQSTVPDVLRAANLFWLPTVRDEAAPLALIQAMATGLPVVASRIGGIPEAVAAAGVLVPPGDAEALARATRPLVDDSGERARIGGEARRRAVSEYSIETMTARTVAVYRVAIARHEAASRKTGV